MPYKLVHHQHSHLVDLVNKHSGKVYAYNTTLILWKTIK